MNSSFYMVYSGFQDYFFPLYYRQMTVTQLLAIVPSVVDAILKAVEVRNSCQTSSVYRLLDQAGSITRSWLLQIFLHSKTSTKTGCISFPGNICFWSTEHPGGEPLPYRLRTCSTQLGNWTSIQVRRLWLPEWPKCSHRVTQQAAWWRSWETEGQGYKWNTLLWRFPWRLYRHVESPGQTRYDMHILISKLISSSTESWSPYLTTSYPLLTFLPWSRAMIWSCHVESIVHSNHKRYAG